MNFGLRDVVYYDNEIGEIDCIVKDDTNNEIISVTLKFDTETSNFSGFLTIYKERLNSVKLFRKYIGGFPCNPRIFYLGRLDDKT